MIPQEAASAVARILGSRFRQGVLAATTTNQDSPSSESAALGGSGLSTMSLFRLNDLRIAAIALQLGATVVTRNRRDCARESGHLIEDWSI